MPDTAQDNHKITQIAWLLMVASTQNKLDVPGEYLWNIPANGKFHEIRSKTWSAFSSGNCIKDKPIIEFIENVNPSKYLRDPHIVKRFEEFFPHWLTSCARFKLDGLEQFKHSCFAQGSQEYFTNFYLMNRHKRFRIFRGEYWWHMEICDKMGLRWAYLEDDVLSKDDVVILSHPFANLGDEHPQYKDLIHQCERMGVPVMLDMIYLPNSTEEQMTIDLNPTCIKYLSFSLSKAFPIANARVALRMTREKILDPIQISNDENVSNRLATGLGLEMMQAFEVDYMVKRYAQEQQHWCKALGLKPTKVVHFALGEPYTEVGRDKNKRFFSKFNDQQNRYNLGPLFVNKKLLQECGMYE